MLAWWSLDFIKPTPFWRLGRLVLLIELFLVSCLVRCCGMVSNWLPPTIIVDWVAREPSILELPLHFFRLVTLLARPGVPRTCLMSVLTKWFLRRRRIIFSRSRDLDDYRLLPTISCLSWRPSFAKSLMNLLCRSIKSNVDVAVLLKFGTLAYLDSWDDLVALEACSATLSCIIADLWLALF